MSHLKSLLIGVPTAAVPQMLDSYIQSAWTNHFETLHLAKQKGNPLAESALEEVQKDQMICQEALAAGVLPKGSQGANMALMFSKLDIPRAVALASWHDWSKKIPTNDR